MRGALRLLIALANTLVIGAAVWAALHDDGRARLLPWAALLFLVALAAIVAVFARPDRPLRRAALAASAFVWVVSAGVAVFLAFVGPMSDGPRFTPELLGLAMLPLLLAAATVGEAFAEVRAITDRSSGELTALLVNGAYAVLLVPWSLVGGGWFAVAAQHVNLWPPATLCRLAFLAMYAGPSALVVRGVYARRSTLVRKGILAGTVAAIVLLATGIGMGVPFTIGAGLVALVPFAVARVAL
jgi:hypothetical protein